MKRIPRTTAMAPPPASDGDDGNAFYHAVARRIDQDRLTLAQGATAFTARRDAIQSFERDGPTVPPSHADRVYQVAWLITQNRLMEDAE